MIHEKKKDGVVSGMVSPTRKTSSHKNLNIRSEQNQETECHRYQDKEF
jgi:hypothetical protein